jgi:adenylate kinase
VKTFKTIIVTGTPGTGKTFLAKKLSLLLDYTYFDANLWVKKAHLYSNYDSKRQAYVVEPKKLAISLLKVRDKALKTGIKDTILQKPNGPSCSGKKGIIFDSHLSHYLPSKTVDLCILTNCRLKILEERLTNRGYCQEKVRENLDSEIFDICRVEALENKHKIITFDTSSSIGNEDQRIRKFAAQIRKILN